MNGRPFAALGSVALGTTLLVACMVDSSLQSGGGSGDAAAGDGSDGAAPDVAPDVPPLPTCSAGVCAPAVPADWAGPLLRYNGAAPAPACPAEYPTPAFDGNAGLMQSAPQCSCSCGVATGASCTVSYTVYNDGSCNNACNSYGIASCASTSACNTGDSVRATATVSGGSCPPVFSKTVPPTTWASTARACDGAQATPKGCEAEVGALCVPAPSGAFSRVCVGKAGVLTCPAAYPIREVYFTGQTDTRDCSACTCGPVAGTTCTGGQVTIYDANGCSGSSTTVAIDGTCKSTGGITTISARQTTAPTPGGTCAKSGGAPIGQATPTGPFTLCCH